jgi:hypothetical protein
MFLDCRENANQNHIQCYLNLEKIGFMKQLFTPAESAELGLLKNMLEETGIKCTWKNQQLFQTLPIGPFNVELWVMNDDKFPRAAGTHRGLAPSTAKRNGHLDLRQMLYRNKFLPCRAG